MLWLLIVLVMVVLAVVFVIKSKLGGSGGAATKCDYVLSQALFTPAERSFLGVLDQAVGAEYRVFGKIRVADVLEKRPGLDQSERQGAQNRINSKHFDFVLCRKDDLAIICVIELNDQSHAQRRRQERDAFLADICHGVGLPMIQITAKHAYSVPELREQVLTAINRPAATMTAPATFATTAGASGENMAERVPSCPNCGATMVRRQAKTGRNAGQDFWGCSTYPQCRGTIQP